MTAARDLPVARFDLRAPAAWVPLVLAAAMFLALLVTGQNRAAFLALNALGPLTSDALWANITVLGDTVVALALCLPLWRRRPDLVWALAIGGLLTTAWVHALKPAVEVPRPPAVLGADAYVIGPAYRRHSFPSGHSTTIFALAGLLALGLPGRRGRAAPSPPREAGPGLPARIAGGAVVSLPLPPAAAHVAGATAIGIAVLAAVSRSVVGVHWPLDLLAGAFGGWLAAALALALARRSLGFGTHSAVQWVVGLLLAGCAAVLVIGYDSGYPQAQTLQRILGVLCLGSAVTTLWRAAPVRETPA